MTTDLRRTLLHGTPAPVHRDDAFSRQLAAIFGGVWDAFVSSPGPGRVSVSISGPGGVRTVEGSTLDALDLDAWERRQLDAAREIKDSPAKGPQQETP